MTRRARGTRAWRREVLSMLGACNVCCLEAPPRSPRGRRGRGRGKSDGELYRGFVPRVFIRTLEGNLVASSFSQRVGLRRVASACFALRPGR